MGEHGTVCERARAWAALQPDGELSGFEQRLLDAHLERCEPCADFARSIVATSEALRAAPLEQLPHPVSVSRAARLPSRPRRLAPRRAGYSAAAAAAAAVLAVSISSGVSVPPAADDPAEPLVIVTSGDDESDYHALRELRRLQLATDIATPASTRAHQFGVSGT
jgi:anti-sigma factor RsiW